MNKTLKSAALSLVSALLVACGGGGGGGGEAAPPPVPTAEGVYGGSSFGPSSMDFELLILENGDLWALYGVRTAGVFFVSGFVQGHTSSSGSTISSSDVRDFGYSPVLIGTLAGTYDATAKTISGTVSAPSGSVGFSGGPIPGSLYYYDIAASLVNIAGPWTLTASTGELIALTVSADGAFAASSDGCTFSGSIVPRPSGKNVFNVNLTFGPSPCALPGQRASGIAVAAPIASGQTQLIILGTNEARTIGTVAFGRR